MNDKKTPNIEKKPSSLRYYQEGVPKVDLSTFRLKVTGQVEREIELSYSDLQKLTQVYCHRRVVCVCLWSIKRHWEGVLLEDVLRLAGVDLNNSRLHLKQLSIGTDKGIYDSTIHMRSAVERGAVLALTVDEQPLSLESGFPIRLIDFALYSYKCVKGLAELHVTQDNQLGYWEGLAGYDLNGIVQPKKYYAVDLHQKFYFDGQGEVFDADIESRGQS